jgi:hypothetical protein
MVAHMSESNVVDLCIYRMAKTREPDPTSGDDDRLISAFPRIRDNKHRQEIISLVEQSASSAFDWPPA